MNLQADSVLGVLFLAPSQPVNDALKMWGGVFPGDSPDGFQRIQAAPPPASQAAGERGGYQVTITSQQGRIDLMVNHPMRPTDVASGPVRITDVHAATEYLADLLKKTSADLVVTRVAIVLDLAKTIERGNEQQEVRALLPFFHLPANATDIAAQFNTRRAFRAAPKILMNRLLVWSTGQAGIIQNIGPLGNNLVLAAPTPYAGLKIDINSAPEFHPAREQVHPMIDEMLSEAFTITDDEEFQWLKP